MRTRGLALTEVQELLDGERRWREARVALDLLRHRLLHQPPEQPHPRWSSAQASRDAQAAAGASAAERRGLDAFARRAPRPRRRGCSRRSSSNSSSNSRVAAGRPRLPQAPPTGAEPAAARTRRPRGTGSARGARPHAPTADWPPPPSLSFAGVRPNVGSFLPGFWDSAGPASAAALSPAPDWVLRSLKVAEIQGD